MCRCADVPMCGCADVRASAMQWFGLPADRHPDSHVIPSHDRGHFREGVSEREMNCNLGLLTLAFAVGAGALL